MNKTLHKYGYSEVTMHNNKIKKLYHLYIHQSFLDKVLDLLVLFAIIFTLMAIVLEFLIGVDDAILHLIHSASVMVFVIFGLELLREYAKSEHYRHFLKKHWIDVFLLVILSLYFLFVSYLGIARAAKEITSAGKLAKEGKEARILFSFFKK